MCLLALAATAPAAVGQSAGDDQYADPFAGQEQPQSSPESAPRGAERVVGQTESDNGSPAANPSPTAQTTGAGTTSGSPSSLPYTGFPAGLVALLGAFVLTAGVMLRVMTGRPPVPRRGAVVMLGRDVRLAPRSRHR